MIKDFKTFAIQVEEMKRKNKQETLEANRNFSGMKTFTTLMRETLENTRANGDEALFVEIAQLYPNDTFVSRNRRLLSTTQTTPSVVKTLQSSKLGNFCNPLILSVSQSSFFTKAHLQTSQKPGY